MAWDAEDTEGSLRSQGRVTLGRRRNSTRVTVFCSGMKARRFVLGVMLVAAAFAGLAEEAANDKVVAVESKNVCMINDRSMANEHERSGGREDVFRLCTMAKERLVKDGRRASRSSGEREEGRQGEGGDRGGCRGEGVCTSRARRISSGTTRGSGQSHTKGPDGWRSIATGNRKGLHGEQYE